MLYPSRQCYKISDWLWALHIGILKSILGEMALLVSVEPIFLIIDLTIHIPFIATESIDVEHSRHVWNNLAVIFGMHRLEWKQKPITWDAHWSPIVAYFYFFFQLATFIIVMLAYNKSLMFIWLYESWYYLCAPKNTRHEARKNYNLIRDNLSIVKTSINFSHFMLGRRSRSKPTINEKINI